MFGAIENKEREKKSDNKVAKLTNNRLKGLEEKNYYKCQRKHWHSVSTVNKLNATWSKHFNGENLIGKGQIR